MLIHTRSFETAKKALACCLLIFSGQYCNAAVVQYQFQVLERLPHNTNTFTQGLVVDGTDIIESSGLYKRSYVKRYSKSSTTQDDRPSYLAPLPKHLFAEGITTLGDDLFLITWKAGVAYKLNKNTLQLRQQFRYSGEGWGMTTIDKTLVMSDGTDILKLIDPRNFRPISTISVKHPDHGVKYLNDLTFGDNILWANVWREDYLLAINPLTGDVIGELNLEALARQHQTGSPENVLNGLAWDEERQALWVTGKRWSQRYLIKPLLLTTPIVPK